MCVCVCVRERERERERAKERERDKSGIRKWIVVMKNINCQTPFKVGLQSDVKPLQANHVQTLVIGQTLRVGRG